MAINPLNLQLSVPRAPELSNLQQQMIHRPVTEQTILEESVARETEEKRTQTSAVDEIEKGIVREDEQEREGEASDQQQKNKKKNQELQEQVENHHPFKGHKLDIRL